MQLVFFTSFSGDYAEVFLDITGNKTTEKKKKERNENGGLKRQKQRM